METEDIKPFLPQTITQEVDSEPSHDEKSRCSTPSEDEADGIKSEILTPRKKTYRSMAIFMKEYFKKHPSSPKTEMIRAYIMETKTPFTEKTLNGYSDTMIRSYRLLRWEFDSLKSCAIRKKLISERCPYYDDIHEAYQYSDRYRNSNWTPNSKQGRTPLKPSELQPTTSNALNNDEMETSDVTLLNTIEQKNDEAVVETPPVNVHDDQNQFDGEEVIMETLPVKGLDCDQKQDSSNEPEEQDNATVKTQVAIDGSKLSHEHQLELLKLEDRKEERQFQMQLTKLRHDNEITKLKLQQENENMKLKLQQENEIMKLKLQQENEIMTLKLQQENEIMKLKLQIEYHERVENCKQ